MTGGYVQSDIVTHTHVVTHTTPHNQLPRLTLSHPPQSHRCRVSHTYSYKYCHTQPYIVTHPAIPWHGLTYVDSQTHKIIYNQKKTPHKPHSYITNPHPQSHIVSQPHSPISTITHVGHTHSHRKLHTVTHRHPSHI